MNRVFHVHCDSFYLNLIFYKDLDFYKIYYKLQILNNLNLGDYFYNKVAVAASHSAGSTVYNANPKTTQASIMTVPDFDDYDDTTPKTITIPKKVTLKLTEAITIPVTTSCGED